MCSPRTTTTTTTPALPTATGATASTTDRSKHPIEFSFDVNESNISSAQLLLLCHDVDQYTEPNNPEIDKVYVNNTYIGDLTGANDEDSTTIFTVPANQITTGKNRIRIDVNQNPGSSPDDWCVEIKQAQLIINGGCTGQATCRSVSTNAEQLRAGRHRRRDLRDRHHRRIATDPRRVESAQPERRHRRRHRTQLHHQRIVQRSRRPSISALPGNAVPGTYTAQVLVFDAASGQLESSCETPSRSPAAAAAATSPAAPRCPPPPGRPAVSFSASASASGNCGTIEYFWTPDHNNTATIFGRNGTWVYTEPGTYTWLFVAVGDNGGRCERTGTIT
jgi:hypothetical protein